MRKELSVEEEITFQDQRWRSPFSFTHSYNSHVILQQHWPVTPVCSVWRSTHKRVFQAVRSVNQSVMRAAAAVPPIPGSARSGVVMTPVHYQSHTPNTEERAGDVDATKWVGLHNVFIPTMLCVLLTHVLCVLQRELSSGSVRLSRRKRPYISPKPPLPAEAELPVRATVLPGREREEAAGAGGCGVGRGRDRL